MAATPSDLICTPENERPTNRQKTDNMTDDLPDIQVRVDLTDRIKAKLRRWLYQIESNKLLLIGFTIAFIIWTASVLCAIILERKYIDNSPNNITTVDGMSNALNVYTYAATYSANKTQSVTLQLLTQNSKVWAIEGDCIRTTKKPLTAYNRTLLHVQRFEAVFNKEGIPLFALANSYLIYTITAVSAIKNKTGCVFFYFFNTKETIEDFLRSNDPSNQLDVQGYYNKSIKCIKTDGLQHDAFFSLNSTGETFVGILANVSTNITYRVRGIIIEYNTSNCQQERIHNLTYNKPLKINICKNIICAFKSNETTIVIDSKEQGVHIHWEPKPLELTLVVWIVIMIAGLLNLICLICLILYCLKFLWKKTKQKRNICTCRQ
uniref:Uncharacterized protein n=1 Tax=Amphimedon queenslandica TaxID=400682 RepID=A0A1X7U3L4_AMPQE